MAQPPRRPAATDVTRRSAGSTGRNTARQGAAVKDRVVADGETVASRTAGEAHAVDSAAQEQGQEIKATAREHAERIRGEVVEQGRGVVAEARSQVESQAHAQTRELADRLARLGEEAKALTEGRPEDAETLTSYLSNAVDALYDAADRVYTLASDIDERGLAGLLRDVEAFARRRPAAFLTGAAVGGFGLGRAVRGSSSDEAEEAVTSARRAP